MVAMVDRALAGAGDAEGTTRFAYDAFGRKASVVRPDGTSTTYEYAPRTGWTRRITHEAASGDSILELAYDRDRSGVIDSIVELHGPAREAFVWNYAYDGLKRLTSAAQTDGAAATIRTYAYQYDRNGNRTSKTINGGAAKASTYNSLDQLLTAGERRGGN
jgi:YD repeat-containing protein